MSASAYVIVAVITVTTFVVILRQVRMRRLKAKYALMWLLVAAVTLPVVLIPGFLDRIASAVGVAYGPALLFLLGLAFLAVLSVHFSCELTRLEERTRVLAEEVALLRGDLQGRHSINDLQNVVAPDEHVRSARGPEPGALTEGATGSR